VILFPHWAGYEITYKYIVLAVLQPLKINVLLNTENRTITVS